MTTTFEVNFDGLVGPTHNYSGLALGNIASTSHLALISNPQEAALQGLDKMRYLTRLGLKQGILPPQERPDIGTLKNLGFSGTDAQVLSQAQKASPRLLAAVCSASSMWTANAATVAPSADTQDKKVHFTPANLSNKFHRSIEASQTALFLKSIFADQTKFVHHDPLPAGNYFGDEGAANHTRFCNDYGSPGLQFFVFGRYAFDPNRPEPKRYPARQTYEASSAIARRHLLNPESVIYAQQNPEAIDLGVFHNDVISVGNQNFFFYHELAFLNTKQVISELQEKFLKFTGQKLTTLCVPAEKVTLKETIQSYLFNTQLITLPSGKMALIAPSECRETPSVRAFLENHFIGASPVEKIEYFDLRQSMRNGGGPACLRLRIALTPEEIAASNPNVYMSDDLYLKLSQWVKKHYRDRLSIEDLADPQLLQESRTALDQLTQILELGSIYPFQR